MVTINFREHKAKDTGKYKCVCGNRFKRTFSDYWTENPFNQTWVKEGEEACNKKMRANILFELSVVVCSKCKNPCERIMK